MKGNHRKKWLGLVFMMAMLLFVSAGEKAFAAEPTTDKSITVQLTTDLGTSKKNVEFKLYQVGSWNPQTERWTLNNELSKTNVVFSDLTGVDAWKTAAETLAQAEELSGLTTQTGTTNADGICTFTNLDYGMYLVVQEGTNSYGTIAPFLVSRPYKVDEAYQECITVTPKAEKFPSSSENTSGGNSGSTSGKNESKENEKKQEDLPQLILVSPAPEQPKESLKAPELKEFKEKTEENQEESKQLPETEEPSQEETEEIPEEEPSQETVAEEPVSDGINWLMIVTGAGILVIVFWAGRILILKKGRKDKE